MRPWKRFPKELKAEIINSCAQSQLCIAARVLPSLRKYVLGCLPRVSKEAQHWTCVVWGLLMLPVPAGWHCSAGGRAGGMHYPAEPAQGSVPLPIPFVPAAVEQSSATNLGVFAVSSTWEFIKAEE